MCSAVLWHFAEQIYGNVLCNEGQCSIETRRPNLLRDEADYACPVVLLPVCIDISSKQQRFRTTSRLTYDDLDPPMILSCPVSDTL